MNNNIFWFEVSMDDPMAMKKRNCIKYIRNYLNDLSFIKNFGFPHDLEQCPRNATLHDQVNVALVVEKSVELDNMGMIQVHLYLYLSDEGLFDIFFLYLSL